MSEEKVIEIKALSPEENPAGKEMETADSEEKVFMIFWKRIL